MVIDDDDAHCMLFCISAPRVSSRQQPARLRGMAAACGCAAARPGMQLVLRVLMQMLNAASFFLCTQNDVRCCAMLASCLQRLAVELVLRLSTGHLAHKCVHARDGLTMHALLLLLPEECPLPPSNHHSEQSWRWRKHLGALPHARAPPEGGARASAAVGVLCRTVVACIVTLG